jgi:patatin-like phospholipase/acyl hydrolase
VISLMPLTAGIRLLSLDGGGVRGVIPLVYLEFLQDRLAELQVPLRDVFDFVCGTSAGKSLALNLVWARSDF